MLLEFFFQGFGGLNEIAEAASAVSLKLRKLLPQSHGNHSHMGPPKPFSSNGYLEYLGKVEAIFETALARKSGPKGGWF
jgi:hypothetical protein